jgi:hypothetical protein
MICSSLNRDRFIVRPPSGDLPLGFRAEAKLRDWLPVRRERCDSRGSRTSRLWRSCAIRLMRTAHERLASGSNLTLDARV